MRLASASERQWLFDAEKNETRHPIDVLADIYAHAVAIRETVHFYD